MQNLILYLSNQFGPYITSENLSLIIGTLMPLLIGFINEYIPNNSKYRAAVSWIVSFIIGLFTVAIAGGFDFNKLVPSILAAYGSSQVVYRFWFKEHNAQSKL